MTKAPEVNVTTVQFDHHRSKAAEDGENCAANGHRTGTHGQGDSSWRARNAAVQACVLASVVTKLAAELAFAAQGRSMTAPDVVTHIGRAFQVLHPEG